MFTLAIPDIRATAKLVGEFFYPDPTLQTKAKLPAQIPALLQFVNSSSAIQIAASADGDVKPFTMVAYTGGPLRLPNFSYPVVVDCAGLTATSQTLPALKDHDPTKIVGHTEQIQIDAATGMVTVAGKTSGSGPAADEVRQQAARGFPWQVSIGAPVQAMDFVDEGETVFVNGRTWQGPLLVARKATLRELSFVAMGADGSTSARIAASLYPEGATAMEFEKWVKSLGVDLSKATDAEKATLKATFDSLQKANLIQAGGGNPTPNPPTPTPPTPTPPTVEQLIEAQRKALVTESARVAAIRRHCQAHPDLEIKAISEGWTEQQTELEVLRASRTSVIGIPAGGGSSQINAAHCYEAALCIAAGIQEARVGKWFDQKVMNEAVSERFRGVSIGTLLHETIRAAGMHARPGSINDDVIRTGIRADRKIRAGVIQAAGFSTLSLSGVLSNVANKHMLASYEAQETVWQHFCAIRNHGDFKVHTRYRLNGEGSLRKVSPSGELKHITMSDTSFTNQLDTYGAIIALTRQMQINDDLGAFLELPTHLGYLAAIRPEEAFFVLLLGNATNFFHANNKNLVTGGGGAMTAANGIAAITAAEQKFSDQVNSNNKPIMVPPARMLVGTANYTAARNIYEGQLKISGKDQVESNKNEHAGKYEPYKSAFMNNTSVLDEEGAAITGQSSTKWFLFADPARRAAIGMAFLNGNRVPTIESDDTEFATLGMQWRCYLDFGVGYEDPAAAVQVNGA